MFFLQADWQQNPPTPLGAGRASGAVVFELVTFAKTSSSHTALLGGLFILPAGEKVEAAGPQRRAFEGRIFGNVLPCQAG